MLISINHRFNLLVTIAAAIAASSSATSDEITAHSFVESQGHPASFGHPNRDNCQIIFVVGVEDPTHHKFTPIIEELASQQADAYGTPYDVTRSDGMLRSVLMNKSLMTEFLLIQGKHDPAGLAKRAISNACPSDGTKRVIIEEITFASDNHPSNSILEAKMKKHRTEQRTLRGSNPHHVTMTESTYLYNFYKFYAPHADIRFVTLHRPLKEMIASHDDDWFQFTTYSDEHVDHRSNEISDAFKSLLKLLEMIEVVDARQYNGVPLSTDAKSWTLVCLEQLMSNYYEEDIEMMTPDETTGKRSLPNLARSGILSNLATFLGWPSTHCVDCFGSWAGYDEDYWTLVDEFEMMMHEHVFAKYKGNLEGVWPPVVKNSISEQDCRL